MVSKLQFCGVCPSLLQFYECGMRAKLSDGKHWRKRRLKPVSTTKGNIQCHKHILFMVLFNDV